MLASIVVEIYEVVLTKAPYNVKNFWAIKPYCSPQKPFSQRSNACWQAQDTNTATSAQKGQITTNLIKTNIR